MESRFLLPARTRFLLPLLLVAAGAAMSAAAVRTSATFDEVVLVSAGARAVETGDWSLVVDQPPLMPLLYGLPFRATPTLYPSEEEVEWDYDDRWRYARSFYFRVGNNPERVALLSRAVAILLALGLVVTTYFYGWWIQGPRTAVLAAALTAFLPDLLAHGAVAYNDVPLALGFLGSVWAVDIVLREPTAGRGALAGILVALAFGVKYSALALAPVTLLLLVAEAARRGRAGTWWREVLLAGLVGLAAAYLVTAALYGADWWLLRAEVGLRFTIDHAARGHPAPAYLLGATNPEGWWYFFPVAFFFKTPAALHLLLPVAVWGLLHRESQGRGLREGLREGLSRALPILGSRLRGPLAALVVFGAFLLTAKLNVGFRYALPALPPLLLLVAAGLSRFWSVTGPRRKVAAGLLLLLYVGSTLSVHPHYLAYVSEWGRTREPGREVLLDSSLDWGQGLLELRAFMAEEGVERVRLSYFGSALPEGYDIAYEPLPGFLPPEDGGSGSGAGDAPELDPRFTVISATNLHGLYFPGADPFASYRARSPDRVLAGSLYVYGN